MLESMLFILVEVYFNADALAQSQTPLSSNKRYRDTVIRICSHWKYFEYSVVVFENCILQQLSTMRVLKLFT